MLYGFNPSFPRLFLCIGQIVHALLTRPPLSIFRKTYFVRLACVRHAASVRPEPGSNSRLIFLLKITHSIIYLSLLLLFCSFLLELSKVSYAVLLSRFLPSLATAWLVYHISTMLSTAIFFFFSYLLEISLLCFVSYDSLTSLSHHFDVVNYQFFLFYTVIINIYFRCCCFSDNFISLTWPHSNVNCQLFLFSLFLPLHRNNRLTFLFLVVNCQLFLNCSYSIRTGMQYYHTI